MYLKKNQVFILIVNLIATLSYGLYFVSKENYEFLLYVGVIIFFLVLIVKTNQKVRYPNHILYGLTFWSFLHMSGGSFTIRGEVLYSQILIPIVPEPYNIFRYDQFVHIVGFMVATLLMFHLLSPVLKNNYTQWVSLSIVVVMAGLGVGALNEIVEFAATVITPETGVGGYINTSLDLVSDLIGAIFAIIIVRKRYRTS